MIRKTIRSHMGRGAAALLLGAALFAAPLAGKDLYKGFLDPALPHHRAILDTLERLKAAPNDAALHNDLGCLVAWDGFWRDALREFDLAAKLDKKDSRPLFNAGLVEGWRGRWGAASGRFGSATRREPGNWPAWWMLGFAREKLGNDEGAVEAYKTSLRVDTSLFEIAKNPFAAESRLKARTLLETYDKRVVRASMPLREEFAGPERIAAFFQRGAGAAPAPGAAVADEPPTGPTGPVVTTAPSASTAPPRPQGPMPRVPRGRQPQPPPEESSNMDATPPVEPQQLNPVTPAPQKKRPLPGPGGAAPEE